MFEISIESNINNEVTYGEFVESDGNPKRQLRLSKIMKALYNHKFNVTVEKHDAKQIKLQLNFEDSASVSTGSKQD